MGKRIRAQRKGGSKTYRRTRFRAKGKAPIRDKNVSAVVLDIFDDPGRSAPTAAVLYKDNIRGNIISPEGLKVNDVISIGTSDQMKIGNVMMLKDISEGMPIHNLELNPGDGGKLVRSSGTFGFIVSKEPKEIRVRLPSKKIIKLKPDCRAAIGRVAGGGRTEKFFVKAGAKKHKLRRRYPTVSGSAMNAVSHPYGGSAKPGHSKTVSRHAPPGQKVGNIAAKRSGKKKK